MTEIFDAIRGFVLAGVGGCKECGHKQHWAEMCEVEILVYDWDVCGCEEGGA